MGQCFEKYKLTDVPPSQPDGNLQWSAASHSIGIKANLTNLKQKKVATTSANEVMLKTPVFRAPSHIFRAPDNGDPLINNEIMVRTA